MAAFGREVRYRIGIDENGLGPRLGPMLVTAVLVRVTGRRGWDIAGHAAEGPLAARLGDSKKLVAHGRVGLAEAWARALVARGAGRSPAADASAPPSRPHPAVDCPSALLDALAADDRSTLRLPCPSQAEAQCWSADGEHFTASDELVRTIAADLDELAAEGVEPIAVRSVVLCTKRINEGAEAGKSRLLLDLHAMERLVLDLFALAGAEVHAVCGKVGGFEKYRAAFGPLAGRPCSVLEEEPARSAYHFPGLGELAFVCDSDASDLCVALASMVGKYLRELLMGRIVRHYQRLVPGLKDVSGYQDHRTAAFIEATRLLRSGSGVPDACFERERARASAGTLAPKRGRGGRKKRDQSPSPT